MIDNIDKVTQRGEKLEDINERAGMGLDLVRGARWLEGSVVRPHRIKPPPL